MTRPDDDTAIPAARAELETAPVGVPASRAELDTSPVGAPVVAAPEPPAVHALAGEVAVTVARQLADPVRGLRDRLGLVVDHLERHVAKASGPTPYPWRALQTLRQDVAAAYLESTALARRLDELDRALTDDPAGWFDLTAAVDLGVHLAGHQLASGLELLIDLGRVPAARGAAGPAALVICQLIALSAESARGLPGSTLSIRVCRDGDLGLVTIADNGVGHPRAPALGELARAVLAPWRATIDTTAVAGAGCVFELRFEVRWV